MFIHVNRRFYDHWEHISGFQLSENRREKKGGLLRCIFNSRPLNLVNEGMGELAASGVERKDTIARFTVLHVRIPQPIQFVI